MEFFQPSLFHTVLFVLVIVFVVFATTYIFWRVNKNNMSKVVGFWIAWSALHFLLAEFGVFYSIETPQIVMAYILFALLFGVWIAFGRVGATVTDRHSMLLLLGLQSFRIPLEYILHGLYLDGNIPEQMTWSGWNFDVYSGVVAAAAFLLFLVKKDVPTIVVLLVNTIGFALIVTVLGIAVASAPGPLRQFANDPPLVLIFFTPWTWIATIAVWTAFVSHLIIFRTLWNERTTSSTQG